jgi:hypothetical protein
MGTVPPAHVLEAYSRPPWWTVGDDRTALLSGAHSRLPRVPWGQYSKYLPLEHLIVKYSFLARTLKRKLRNSPFYSPGDLTQKNKLFLLPLPLKKTSRSLWLANSSFPYQDWLTNQSSYRDGKPGSAWRWSELSKQGRTQEGVGSLESERPEGFVNICAPSSLEFGRTDPPLPHPQCVLHRGGV